MNIKNNKNNKNLRVKLMSMVTVLFVGLMGCFLASCDDELDIQQSYPFTVETMPVPNVRMMLFGVPPLEELDAAHRPLKPRQAIYPCRLHAVALCKQRADRQECTADSHEYPHHHDKGLKLPMGTTDSVSSFTFWLLKSNSSS